MSVAWLEQRERGSAFAMGALVWLTRTLGRRLGRLMLAPICGYFLVFSRRARSASFDYLSRVSGRKARLAEVFCHYHTFAATLLDRVELLGGEIAEFDIEVHGREQLDAALSANRGCILLGSHLGSFEVLRALGAAQRRITVNALMYQDNAAKMRTVLERLAPGHSERIIALGRPDALLRAKECLERGEIVGLLGDRYLDSEKTTACGFLGTRARFPQAPLRLARTLGVPVVLFFGLHTGDRRYAVHFERFAIEPETVLEVLVTRYAGRLEHYCRTAPYNWFNFYPFWDA